MAAKNEMLIAGGIVAAGLAYFLLSGDDAQAAVPPPRPPGPPLPPTPGPGPSGPAPFQSTRCPGIDSDLPDEYKRAVDAALASGWTGAEYEAAAKMYEDQGWSGAVVCLREAASKAAAAQHPDIFAPVPGGQTAIDQTTTCGYWVQNYNAYNAQISAIKANAVSAQWQADHPNWLSDLQLAQAGMVMARNAIVQLGGCGISV